VVTAVEKEHDGGAPAERVEGIEEGLAEEARRVRAAAVQEDERPAGRVWRHDSDLVEIAVHESAVQRVVLDPRATRRPVATSQIANDEVDRDRRDNDHGYRQDVPNAADWLRQERRKVLGDWVAFCLGCGAARRWFENFEAELPETCPQCGGELLRRCRACGAPFSSVAVVDCEECGEQVRPNELFGSKIRRTR
jgi:DNA-directed RNA polymerase subunit RPC12/RpoP